MVDFEGAKSYVLSELSQNLPDNLTYHGLWHTKDVYRVAVEFADYYKLTGDDRIVLETAALYHDSGFLRVYRNHEEAGCEIASDVLPGFHYSQDLIEQVCELIMATKLPQSPRRFLSELICDSDLDYIGGNDYVRIANLLFEEFKEYHIVTSEMQWFEMQVGFLETHSYFSDFSRQFRNPGKLQNLKLVKAHLEKLRQDER
ncbi:MAG: HD domain-containing protein [Bacteroidetes bacterium]|nr:HD domain-containing protein [Bacteroidota bacterium]